MTDAARSIQPTDLFHVPKRRRLLRCMETGSDGRPILFLHYGMKELCFDDPRLIAFGEGLFRASQFNAGEACKWSDSAPYEWEEVQGLLTTLVDEGWISPPGKDEAAPDLSVAPRQMKFSAKPQTWTSDHETTTALLQRVFERPLQLSQLESAIVISRVAHPAQDATGRQVGEASVFPPALRLDVATDWQMCPYSGSRFEAPVPMNASALKLVAAQWNEVLSLAAYVRSSFMSRMDLPPGRLSLLDLYLLCVTTLALPAYAMVRSEQPISNGALPPLLALLFKVVDGVRIVATHVARSSNDSRPLAQMRCDPRELIDVCERRALFYSDSGVCAAPDAMIEAFLSLWIDGTGADAESEILGQQLLVETVNDPETAFRYGMHGLRLVNISMAFRGRMAEFMESALATLSSDPAGSEDVDRLRVALAAACDEHVTHSLARPTTRATNAILARDAFAKAAEALGSDRVDLDSLLTTSVPPDDEALAALATQLTAHAPGFSSLTAESLRKFANTLASYLQCEAATLSALQVEQAALNEKIGRSSRALALTGDDLSAILQLSYPDWTFRRVLWQSLQFRHA